MHNKKCKGLCGNPTLPNSSVASKTLAVTKTHHQNKLINCFGSGKISQQRGLDFKWSFFHGLLCIRFRI